MSRVSNIVSKLDKALIKNRLSTRKVYLRSTTRTGGDALLGKGGTITTTDKELVPLPAVDQPSVNGPYVFGAAGKTDLADYILIVSPTACSEAELRVKGAEIVMKDAVGEEVFCIEGLEPTVLDGQVALFTVLCKSKAR